jgi:hypothetical protein
MVSDQEFRREQLIERDWVYGPQFILVFTADIIIIISLHPIANPNSGNGGPWEWRALGMAGPGNGGPWEWRALGMAGFPPGD